MYLHAADALGRLPMLHGLFAGPLSGGPLTDALQDFLNQVRKRPQDYKKLLLTAILHPNPANSRTWIEQTFTFDQRTRHLIDEVLMSAPGQSGQAEIVVRDELRRIALAGFKQEIQAERQLQNEMIKDARALSMQKLKPFLLEPLFPPTTGEPEEYKLARMGLYFAGFGLPQPLAQRIVNSEASEVHSTILGKFLRDHGKELQRKDRAFNALVEQERKRRQQGKKQQERTRQIEEERKRRQQRGSRP